MPSAGSHLYPAPRRSLLFLLLQGKRTACGLGAVWTCGAAELWTKALQASAQVTLCAKILKPGNAALRATDVLTSFKLDLL